MWGAWADGDARQGVYPHATSYSFREIQAVLRLIGVERPYQSHCHKSYILAHSPTDPPTTKQPGASFDKIIVKIISI